MVSVFICENNSVKLDLYTQIVNNHILINEFDMQVAVSASNSQQIMEYLKHKKVTGGLYFLNVGLGAGDSNGIQLATQIRLLDPIAKIIFISKHIETMYLALERKVEPMDFIVKTNRLEEIKERIEENIRTVFSRYIRVMNLFEDRFEYRVGLQWRSIALNELIFVESSGQSHKIILHSLKQNDEFYANIADLAKKYPKLYRCHRSYLINPDNVSCYNPKAKQVSFINGDSCAIASRRVSDFKKLMTTTF